MEAFVLVDYDNILDGRPERSRGDAEANLTEIALVLSSECAKRELGIQEVVLRLYGGWINQLGQYTRRAQNLLVNLSSVRRRMNGILVQPELVYSLANHCQGRFIGTLREDRSPIQQKMVDTLMAVDAITLCATHPIFLATDDDDLVPAVSAAAVVSQRPVHLLRRRGEGSGLNDAVCSGMKVQFITLPTGF